MLDMSGQLIAAILHEKNAEIPRAMGIKPEHLDTIPAQQALAAIYEYVDDPKTPGYHPPGVAYLQQRLIPAPPVYDPTVGDLVAISESVRLSALRKAIVGLLQVVGQTATADPQQAFERLQEQATGQELLSLVSAGQLKRQAEIYEEFWKTYKTVYGVDLVGGVPTPFPTLTKAILGWRKGGYYTLFAPPKNFKTFIAFAAGATLYGQGLRVLIVNGEITNEEAIERMMALTGEHNFDALIRGDLPDHVISDALDDVDTVKAPTAGDIVYYRPTTVGLGVVDEVRAIARKNNVDGKLALIIWDGHYRSAKSPEWQDVYGLVRKTQTLPLDESLGQVPLLVTTQAGSGARTEVGYKAYEQESTAILSLEKTSESRARLQTAMVRKGTDCGIEVEIDFTKGVVQELGKLSDAPGVVWHNAGF